MTLELLKQQLKETEELVALIESGSEQKGLEIQERVQGAINKLHSQTQSVFEQFKAQFVGVDEQRQQLYQEIQKANSLHPETAKLMQVRATLNNPIDLNAKLWKLQTEHPLDQWEERIKLMRGVMLAYLKQTGVELLVPCLWHQTAKQITDLQWSDQLMTLFHNNWKTWLKLHWAIQDKQVFNEMSYWMWAERQPTKLSFQRWQKLNQKLPPVIRTMPHLDPEYTSRYDLLQ
ncbi:MAG TPA: hypothetical protein V6D10_07300 [Trichocoleus sp.]|jgi:hypothetical protein